MGMRRKAWAATAAGVLAAVALTGCGGDDGDEDADFADQSIEDIKDAVLDDMKQADSFTLTGDFTQDGQPLSIDMAIGKNGDCAGSITIQGGTAEVIAGPDGTFMKGDEAFWTVAAGGNTAQAQQLMSFLGDKWAKMSAADAGNFAELCDVDNFIDELEDSDEDDAEGEKGDREEIDGQDALEITAEGDDGGTNHIWVATEGEHYILKLEAEGGDEPGALTFTDYNEPVDAEAPAEGEYVEFPE